MRKAYFDDAGAAELAIGGCVAPEDEWESIDRLWDFALKDFGITWFHAKDFEDGRHLDYAHLSASDRGGLFERLLDIVHRHVCLPTGASLCMIMPRTGIDLARNFGARDRLAHKRRRKDEEEKRIDRMVGLYHDPYCMCLGTCLLWLLDRCGVGADEHGVHIFLAHQKGHTEKAAFVYAMATHIPRWAGILLGFSNGGDMEPRKVRPLQVADFVAYYLAKSRRKNDLRARRVATILQPSFVDYCRALSVTDGWVI